MKRCSSCKEHREETEYTKDKNRKDGLNPQCKLCKRTENRKRYDHTRMFYTPEESRARRRERDRVAGRVRRQQAREASTDGAKRLRERKRREKMIAIIESKSSTAVFKIPEKCVAPPKIGSRVGNSHKYWKAPMLSPKEAKAMRKGILTTIEKLLGK